MRFFLGIIAAAVVGCGSAATPDTPQNTDAADAPVAATYDKGTKFPDLDLLGVVDRNADGLLTSDEFGPFRVSEIVSGSPDYLLVHVAFGWCEWCWAEAKEQMRWYRGYAGKLRVVQVYVDDLKGQRADRSDLEFWIEQNRSFLPAGLESAETLYAKFGKNATYLLIDIKNGWKIVDVGGGPPAFRRIEGILSQKLGALPNP
jgi:hypothetical protein